MAAVTLHKRPVRPLPDPPCQQLINLSASLPLLVVDASGVLGSLGEPQTLPNTICPFFCRALYDNIVHNAPSEFSFRKNDIIEVVACLESGWWGGLLDGQRGWFPSSYVTVIQPETFVNRAQDNNSVTLPYLTPAQSTSNPPRDMKIYQHLAIHAFFHLVRGRNQSLLVAFQNHIKEWKQWDIIRCLTNHQIIRDSLLALLLTSEELSPMCHSPGVDVSELPKLDAKVMVLHLAAILDDSDLSSRKHKDIFALRGKDAQSMVDLLHDLLEGPVIDSDQRTLLTDALVRLTRRSCCHPKCFVLNDIEIDVTHPVIAGGYSEVWKGYILGRPVAVKKVRNSRSDLEEILKACAREAIIWSRLSHPNLLPFYGIFYLDDECSRISLVSPWMDNGDVSQYLKHFPDTNRELLALDVSLGVEYLHTSMPAVIHGDLKPRNIFITSSGTACLADFGLAYAKDPQRLTATSTEGPVHSGTLAYEAPEMFDGHPVSFAADVYAFACVVYEMYSGSPPFHELRPAGVIRAIIGGQRPLRPVGISSSVWGVVENCWQQGPAERPCASDIVHDLRSIAGPEQRPHQWDESFRAHIRSSHSSYWLTPSGRCSDTWTSLHMT